MRVQSGSNLLQIAFALIALQCATAMARPAFPGQHAAPTPTTEAASAQAPSTQPTEAGPGDIRPSIAPTNSPAPGPAPIPLEEPQPPEDLPPVGYAGPRVEYGRSGSADFMPIPDRWRIGIPGDYADSTRGSIFNPYNQNVLKGDYPILGQDKFLVLTLTSDTLYEVRRTPTPSDVSAANPGSFKFFGSGRSDFGIESFIFSADFFQGDASYRPKDWDFRFTGVANGNYLHASDLGVVSPDVLHPRDRTNGFVALQEAFAEYKIADLSPNFDFISLRAGVQGFTSDFRGFLFSDDELGVRLFGNLDNNRLQYNLAWFNQLEKDTNSGLNTLDLRNEQILIANVYRQDFFFPGYTAQFSFQANMDHSGAPHYDTDGFLVRPQPVGTIQRKDVNAYYFGWAGDGHIGRWNLTHQVYQVIGNESFNPIAGRPVEINAQFAAVELSYDMDYIRFRGSFLFASGDHHPESGHATGFDSIFDNPNFAGGGFSYFDRQAIALTGSGVNLVNRFSLLPDLRTSKEQGQANFVNPGLMLLNLGADIDLTPQLKLIADANYLRFESTRPLELLLQDHHIRPDIGMDYSIGVRYRPLLNNNVIFTGGVAALVPAAGFVDLYNSNTLYSAFFAATITY